MNNTKNTDRIRKTAIKDELLVTDPGAVSIIFHEKKGEILTLLIEKEMTIIDLKHTTSMNPGTIKRHINDLLKYGLAYISRTRVNEFGIVMKYYRATAKSFTFKISWP